MSQACSCDGEGFERRGTAIKNGCHACVTNCLFLSPGVTSCHAVSLIVTPFFKVSLIVTHRNKRNYGDAQWPHHHTMKATMSTRLQYDLETSSGMKSSTTGSLLGGVSISPSVKFSHRCAVFGSAGSKSFMSCGPMPRKRRLILSTCGRGTQDGIPISGSSFRPIPMCGGPTAEKRFFSIGTGAWPQRIRCIGLPLRPGFAVRAELKSCRYISSILL